MRQMAYMLSNVFVRKNIIYQDVREVYQYGLELFFSTVVTCGSILLYSVLADSFWAGILYLLFSIPLRMAAGGYHAKTYTGCFITSNLVFRGSAYYSSSKKKGG